ncbi:TetR family transcriptional regulator [Mycolicibacterium fluoranthenivorans]|jgi:DNA-binding transcriptional regulator YbjK|uniref:TetR family transcriptional regulator n=1 Tax=Mycolicibacterium fluoranthenivorans TaxID=258505 RepID=A0A1G4WSA8_9MYCO|nr:TetR/AcrR family transcriptional regulator [Mycolicibacterium fluoranthenivorans]QNJ93036.1 TetR family transcriptional regulator [Mycolicibacterium fluoranthenivorans]SCX28606.1 transcriptional regulator, TetR family [Mycolicibacterium fluoranthenivorans]
MPPNPHRRAVLLDAAIDILGEMGAGGLTHRAVDERAGQPAGTTSNYFRTRMALLEATAARLVELQWQHVGLLQNGLGTLNRETLATMMTAMVTDLGGPNGRRQLARYELFNEGVRRPELRPLLSEMQSAALKSASLLLAAAGLAVTDEQVGELARLLNGLAYSNLTFIAGQPGASDLAGLVERMLTAVLGQSERN